MRGLLLSLFAFAFVGGAWRLWEMLRRVRGTHAYWPTIISDGGVVLMMSLLAELVYKAPEAAIDWTRIDLEFGSGLALVALGTILRSVRDRRRGYPLID